MKAEWNRAMVSRSALASGTPNARIRRFEITLQFAARSPFGMLHAIQDFLERRVLPVRRRLLAAPGR